MLALPHVVYAVNKMDLVEFSEERFDEIARELAELGSQLEIRDATVIPLSALKGDNVVDRTDAMPWYAGPTLLEHLETIELAGDLNVQDRRFPVQWVIRPMADEHHDYRGYAGRVAGGVWRAGDEVVVLPSGLRSRVAAVDSADGPLEEAIPRESVTILLEDDVDVSRGDLLADPERAPVVARELTARVSWMAERPRRGARPPAGQAHDAHRPRPRRRDRQRRRHPHARGPAEPRARWSSTTSASCASAWRSRSSSTSTCATAAPGRSS